MKSIILSPLRRCLVPALFLGSCMTLLGCSRSPGVLTSPEPPDVEVSYPVERTVSDYADFTGRTKAIESVDLRARVWGELVKVDFKEGEMVKKGDVLYEIDPRTYQAALDQSNAKVLYDEAQQRYSEADYKRNVNLRSGGSVSQEDVDKAKAGKDSATASVAADKADVRQKQLDLEFTKVVAPITGRISRTNVTVGNVIQSGQNGGTLLTTIVSVDPIYAYFDVDERTVLYVRSTVHKDRTQPIKDAKIPVYLALENEEGFPHEGIIDFADNQIDTKTGTLRVRGNFPNKTDIISPGMFCRIRVNVGRPHKAILVSDRAIDVDQGHKIVYIVNDQNEVSTREVKIGAMHDGLLAIDEGLSTSDRVVVNGLQRIRAGIKVAPKMVEMPVTK